MTKDFLRKTIQVWQPLSENKLTEEDAREIAENISGFFSLLRELEQKHGKEEEKT